MDYGCIYKIVNKLNGKTYVGQTISTISHRFSQHKKASTKYNTYLYNAIKKYGIDNFKIEQIDTASSLEELNNKEIYWIKTLNTKYPNGYNIANGGNGVKGFKHSAETKELLRLKSKGNKNALGKHNISRESKEKMILAHKNKPSSFKNKKHTIEARRKISLSQNKKVRCIETNEIYPSSLIASQLLKIPNHIGSCCKGKRKTCGGYHWCWV